MTLETFEVKNFEISSLDDFLKAIIKDKTILDFVNTTCDDIYLLAAHYGHLDIMKFLENEHNWDIYDKNIYGNDAYMLASMGGQLEIMKYLENEHNWDVYVKNDFYMDAYLYASMCGHLEIMKYLENEHDWDIYVMNNDGKNALALTENQEIKDYLNELYGVEKEEEEEEINEEELNLLLERLKNFRKT